MSFRNRFGFCFGVAAAVIVASPLLSNRGFAQSSKQVTGPSAGEIPIPEIKTSLGKLPGPDQLPERKEMPDVLTMNDGTKVTTPEQWHKRREEMKKILEYYSVGLAPPPPGNVKGTVTKEQMVMNGKVKYQLVHLTFGPEEKLSLDIGVFTPTEGGPFPTVINIGGSPPGATILPRLPMGQPPGDDVLLKVGPAPGGARGGGPSAPAVAPAPATPGAAATPATPAVPAAPATPATPAAPASQSAPAQPSAPATPAVPSTPPTSGIDPAPPPQLNPNTPGVVPPPIPMPSKTAPPATSTPSAAAPVQAAAPQGPRGGFAFGGGASAEQTASRNQALAHGFAYVTFNYTDCGEDTTLRLPDGSWAFRTTRFYPAYPGYDWGLLRGWAWGVSRIVDYLETEPWVDKSKLIITGVSRNGKAALVAGAFDDRISMVAPVASSGGGTPAYRFSGIDRGGKEGLGDMMRKYPNWFAPHLHDFWGQTDKLPFDE
ncbi:MAG TPA: hypothetical protein VGJ15_04415, partial [Pirellulales bacterium]